MNFFNEFLRKAKKVDGFDIALYIFICIPIIGVSMIFIVGLGLLAEDYIGIAIGMTGVFFCLVGMMVSDIWWRKN